MLDIFKQNAFGVVSLTDAINKVPFVPGRAGSVIDWNEKGVSTTSIVIEEIEGELKILNPTPRGGVGETSEKKDRKIRNLTIPHYQHDDALMADEVQGVRAFGSETLLETLQQRVNDRQTEHVQLKLDPTLEYQRVGAVKGIILNGDGGTLYNLFNEFSVAQPAEVAFNLGASTDPRKKCATIVRAIATALGGVPFRGVYAFCGDDFFDDLISHSEVKETFKYQEGLRLRQGIAYQTLDYGGVTFENYRGAIGATAIVHTDKAHFFPVGSPGLWRTVYAPADYIETVNTPGLPRYSRQWRMPNDKGINLESQMNALNYCTRPNALIQGKRGA